MSGASEQGSEQGMGVEPPTKRLRDSTTSTMSQEMVEVETHTITLAPSAKSDEKLKTDDVFHVLMMILLTMIGKYQDASFMDEYFNMMGGQYLNLSHARLNFEQDTRRLLDKAAEATVSSNIKDILGKSKFITLVTNGWKNEVNQSYVSWIDVDIETYNHHL